MQVGHASTLLVDTARDNRVLGVNVWYPARSDSQSFARYELLPNIGLTSEKAMEHAPLLVGKYPILVWSHGRTGMRFNYSQLCESLASCGCIVIAPDHPGDTLNDWLLGANVDDTTNEIQRLGDISFVLDALTGHVEGLPDGLFEAVDTDSMFVGGHSYGGLTAIISATGIHGLAPDPRVRKVVCAQAYTRTLPAELLRDVSVPVLFLVGSADLTTPPSSDADPAWEILRASDLSHRRVDLPEGGHQACSDFALYMELLPAFPGVPALVTDYLDSIAADSPQGFQTTWRETLGLQIREIVEFLDLENHLQ
jgi:predicted dienelactone hydrolase